MVSEALIDKKVVCWWLSPLGEMGPLICSMFSVMWFCFPGRTYPWGNKFMVNRTNLWQVGLLTSCWLSEKSF